MVDNDIQLPMANHVIYQILLYPGGQLTKHVLLDSKGQTWSQGHDVHVSKEVMVFHGILRYISSGSLSNRIDEFTSLSTRFLPFLGIP